MHQTIAQAPVEVYRLRGCIEKHEFQRRLGEHEAHLAGWLMLHGEVLPPDADLPAVWQVARHSHRQELRLLLPVKNARGPDRTGLSFSVEAALGEERLQWQDKVGEGGRGDRISDAARCLRQALGDGPMKASQLLSLGEENGYTSRMLHHAKFAAGVAVFREEFGRGAAWNWILLSAHESEPLKNA